MSSAGPLAGRVAIVTGASRGIGAAAAVALAAAGAQLVLVGRTSGGLEETDDAIRRAVPDRKDGATLVPMDLTDGSMIDQLGAAVHERFGRLDVLVGNAGVLGEFRPLAHYTPAIWDKVVNTNLTANWRLIRVMEPLLRQSDAGRAIFVTAGVATEPRSFWGPYAVSKAALEMLAGIWAEELRRTPVRINLIDPGIVRTRMRAQGFPGEDPEALPPPESVAGLFVELASPGCVRHGETLRAC
ncbi:MAG: SDR family NAD(P)-dependent oxidoreductase [Acetobacterales bacterium]